MKKLILVRHAKSSWKYNLGDIDRPLKSRGVIDAYNVSKEFKTSSFNVDVVYSSPAARAKKTSEIFSETIGMLGDRTEIVDKLYDFGGENLVNFIKLIDNKYDDVMIFGHNHAMTAFANDFGSIYIDNVPTCGLVVIEFDINTWVDLKPGKTIKIIFPKELRV